MVVAPPHHSSIARALGPVAATMRAAIAELGSAPQPSRSVVVAVSGGADSMATLGLLELLRRRLGLALVVAHVDHGLRAGAGAEAELVAATARARGHRLWRTRLVLPEGPGLPARARAARHAALIAAAEETGAALVVLGHTMTDQAETVLLNLCRGAGVHGLAGMRPWQPWLKPGGDARRCPPSGAMRECATGLWVRPMMQLTRDETRGLAERFGLAFVDDPGNDDPAQPRVRLRRGVLPVLASINAAAVGHIATAARVARGFAVGQGTLASESDAALGSVAALRARPEAGRRAAILELCRRAGVPADAVAARTLDAIVSAVAYDTPHRWDLHGAVLRLDAERLWTAAVTPHGRPECTRPEPAGPEPARSEPLTHPMPAAILPAPGRNA
jgi:tRNA(Ile)-lysidine synthase